MNCFCGSQKEYSNCCGPYLKGEKHAPTPEALMRSRYSAYVQGNLDYIAATMRGKAAEGFDLARSKERSDHSEWFGLQVMKATAVAPGDSLGFVEFIARYKSQGQEITLHELSEFHFEEGRWFYVDGKLFNPSSQSTKNSKQGRNDPCACGSGKKYKKCCG